MDEHKNGCISFGFSCFIFGKKEKKTPSLWCFFCLMLEANRCCSSMESVSTWGAFEACVPDALRERGRYLNEKKKVMLEKIRTLSNLAGRNRKDGFTWPGWSEEITLMKGENSLTWTKSGTGPTYSENLWSSPSCPECTNRTDQSVNLTSEVCKPRLDSRAALGPSNPNKLLKPNKWKEGKGSFVFKWILILK